MSIFKVYVHRQKLIRATELLHAIQGGISDIHIVKRVCLEDMISAICLLSHEFALSLPPASCKNNHNFATVDKLFHKDLNNTTDV